MTWKSWCAIVILVLIAVWGLTVAWFFVENRDEREYFALRDEGGRLIRQFEAHRPDHIPPNMWHAVIVAAHETWGSVSFQQTWGSVLLMRRLDKTSRLKAAVEDLRLLAAGANAENSIERLEQFFDMLVRYWPESEEYIELSRETCRKHLSPSHREFMALSEEGERIIHQFEEHRPAHIPEHGWDLGMISAVYTAWVHLFDSPAEVEPKLLESAKAAVEELRRLEADANPANAVERLDQMFDVMLRYRPEKERDIEDMRERYHDRLLQFDADAAGESPP